MLTSIIVEGPRGAGKDTFVKTLMEHRRPGHMYHHIHNIPPVDHDTVQDARRTMLKMYASQIRFGRNHGTVIQNRGHISEAVYGKLWRCTGPWGVRRWEDHMATGNDENIVLVTLMADVNVLHNRRIARARDKDWCDEYEIERERNLFIREHYESVLPKILLDTQNKTHEDNLKLLVEAFPELQKVLSIRLPVKEA